LLEVFLVPFMQNCSNLLLTTELEVVHESKELPNYTEKNSVGQLPSLAG
jgi:hypothetical protein